MDGWMDGLSDNRFTKAHGYLKISMCAASNTPTLFLPSINLLIDDEREPLSQSSETFQPDGDSQVSLGKDTFKGCISNVYLRR